MISLLHDALHGPCGRGHFLLLVSLFECTLELSQVPHQEDAFALVHAARLADPHLALWWRKSGYVKERTNFNQPCLIRN